MEYLYYICSQHHFSVYPVQSILFTLNSVLLSSDQMYIIAAINAGQLDFSHFY